MMFLRLIRAEFDKLQRSLALLMVFAPPLMVLVMVPTVLISGNGPDTWEIMAMSGAGIWAYLLFPLTVTALTALLASIEHQSASWTWTLSQPTPKVMVFAAKAVMCVVLTGLVTVGIGAAIIAGGLIAGAVSHENALSGALPLGQLAALLSKMLGAGLLMVALQFVVANGVRSFAIPIIVGIGGTFVAVVATTAKAGVYFPWLMPVNILASDPQVGHQALMTGIFGALVVFTLGCVWLARRDWR